ncbi:hypothetical protein Pyrfu_0548 [Pyrolobus fumarii 1A]|uniref:Uncharacterized protein n=1 Tax=Pyrolobus fumarii (strain DSM 11204 / 1A) TaxID=694429 RepID=G0EGW9_PYRF1|nr:hypothetical protein [Pyrolobus fumarii]AEM38419.1 hypothetical protein Pyrfu_0548 [Pyrolobus fumarii 1A]
MAVRVERLALYTLLAVTILASTVVLSKLYSYITTNVSVGFASTGIEVRGARVVEKPDGVDASISVEESLWGDSLVIDISVDGLSDNDRVVFEFEVVNTGSRSVELSVESLKRRIGGWGCYVDVTVQRRGLLGWINVNTWDKFELDAGDSMTFRIIIEAPSGVSDSCAGDSISDTDVFKLSVEAGS